jgi:hypothetical protein
LELLSTNLVVIRWRVTLTKKSIAIANTKGRTIRYLMGGGLGNNQKKIRAQKQSRKKISCTTNLLEKKIEQGLGVIFKILVQLF